MKIIFKYCTYMLQYVLVKVSWSAFISNSIYNVVIICIWRTRILFSITLPQCQIWCFTYRGYWLTVSWKLWWEWGGGYSCCKCLQCSRYTTFTFIWLVLFNSQKTPLNELGSKRSPIFQMKKLSLCTVQTKSFGLLCSYTFNCSMIAHQCLEGNIFQHLIYLPNVCPGSIKIKNHIFSFTYSSQKKKDWENGIFSSLALCELKI